MQTICAIDGRLEEQVRIVNDVFSTMVDIRTDPVEAYMEPDIEVVTAAVYFTEPWFGALFVECTLPLAFNFTARLMSLPVPTEIDEDVCDALGELANIVGGNLKALLPSNVGLSLPSIVRGTDYAVRLRGGVVVNRQVFDTEFGKFQVTLMGHQVSSQGIAHT